MSYFLPRFKRFTEASEVHPNHAIWAGLITMSALVGKKVHVPLGAFNIFPNLYVVFVAPPGGRKSTAMDYTGAFLEQIEMDVMVDSITKESLVSSMVKSEIAFTPQNGDPVFVYSPTTILATEMSEIIGPSKDGMISFLTTLFDKRGDYKNKTIKRGMEHIVKPYLTLLGCTTPAWVTARLRDDVISGGFSRRAIFVFEDEEAERKAFPEVTPDMKQCWDEAMTYAQNVLKNAYGPMNWSEAARAKYKHWYENQTYPKDPNIVGYYKSKHIQVMKVASLISLSESPSMILEERHWDLAFDLLSMTEQNLPRVFEGVGRNELNAGATRLIDLLRRAGGYMSEKDCYGLLFVQYQEYEIKQMIEHLCNTDKIVKANIKNNKTGLNISCLFTPDGHAKMQREIDYARKQHEATQQAGLLQFIK